ncbi:hypothetical protein SDC9_208167 [bioreactor metagenome]|uniref:Uncharacterized protein n=1 Tax=bioreactor metagenome TaxID=1076179 RepID=A0A645JCG6_9ZZZZ
MIDKGLAGYSLSADMFTAVLDGHSRAGNKPLIIKAIALRDDNCSIVISNADADAMLAGNTAVGFLKDCAVIFVK